VCDGDLSRERILGLLAAGLGLASLLGLLGLLTLGYYLTLVIAINAYLFIAVTSLFSRYLLIVVLVIYSLLKTAAEKGACRKRKWSKTGSLSLLRAIGQSLLSTTVQMSTAGRQ